MRNTSAPMTPALRLPEWAARPHDARPGASTRRRGSDYKEALWAWLGEGFDRHGAFLDPLGDGSPDLSDFGL